MVVAQLRATLFMYLCHILTRIKAEIIKKVYNIQKVTKGDWYGMIQKEKTGFNVILSDLNLNFPPGKVFSFPYSQITQIFSKYLVEIWETKMTVIY